MYYLLSVLLKEADLLREADPLHDILELWKRFGLPSAMILNHVNLQDMAHYYALALNIDGHPEDNGSVASFLFEAPQHRYDDATAVGDMHGHHRMLIALIDSSQVDLEALLDATEAVLQARACPGNDLLFVFPVVHVRGFPSAPRPKNNRHAHVGNRERK